MVRLRNRYIVIEIEFKDERKRLGKLSSPTLIRAIHKSIHDLHGIYGLAVSKAGLHASYLNPETRMAFVRMRRSAYKIVTSALALLSSIDGEPCTIRTLYTGGTIKHSNMFLQKFQRRQLEEKYASLKTDIAKKEFEQQLDSVSFTTIPLFRK